MKRHGPRIPKTILTKESGRNHCLILRLNTQSSRECGIGRGADTQTSGTEKRTRNTPTQTGSTDFRESTKSQTENNSLPTHAKLITHKATLRSSLLYWVLYMSFLHFFVSCTSLGESFKNKKLLIFA